MVDRQCAHTHPWTTRPPDTPRLRIATPNTNQGRTGCSEGQIAGAAPTSSIATTHQPLPLSEIEVKI